MDIATAKIILSNLHQRIEVGSDGKFRLPGILTHAELEALELLAGIEAPIEIGGSAAEDLTSTPTHDEDQTDAHTNSLDEDIVLNLSVLELPDSNASCRVCLDFGTAMSKATFVKDQDANNLEEIKTLYLGHPGDQEQIDEIMLVSSVFIDNSGLLWFGQKAVNQSQIAPEESNSRMDNIKRALSEGNLNEPVDPTFNNSGYDLTYKDVVLAYLTFFTWTVNQALTNDIGEGLDVQNFNRRFAIPCFPSANAKIAERELDVLLGEAQVLADTLGAEIHEGLPIGRYLSALQKLRELKIEDYSFVVGSVTEPLGVAGSLISWHSSVDILALVVDIGAGTSDFSLYRIKVDVKNDGTIDESSTRAGEIKGSARGITEAGNHLDKILKAHILKKGEIDSSHPKYINIAHALERDIRNHKESLFIGGTAYIVLYDGSPIEVTLEEFMALDAVVLFENSLRETLIDILQKTDKEWIDWVRSDPRRRLTIVLTGGGASLPMARKLAEGTIDAHNITIPVAPALSFPTWLSNDYPDLEDHYSRIAVSLGGARRDTLQSMGILTSTGSGLGGFQLEKFPTRGV